jgi:hypothetical protein
MARVVGPGGAGDNVIAPCRHSIIVLYSIIFMEKDDIIYDVLDPLVHCAYLSQVFHAGLQCK